VAHKAATTLGAKGLFTVAAQPRGAKRNVEGPEADMAVAVATFMAEKERNKALMSEEAGTRLLDKNPWRFPERPALVAILWSHEVTGERREQEVTVTHLPTLRKRLQQVMQP